VLLLAYFRGDFFGDILRPYHVSAAPICHAPARTHRRPHAVPDYAHLLQLSLFLSLSPSLFPHFPQPAFLLVENFQLISSIAVVAVGFNELPPDCGKNAKTMQLPTSNGAAGSRGSRLTCHLRELGAPALYK